MKAVPNIWICDDDYRRTELLDIYNTCTYTERFANRDSWEISLPRKSPAVPWLKIGRILHMYDPISDIVRCLILKQINISDDEIRLAGNDYAGDLLGQRICLSEVSSGTGYDTQSGSRETVIRHFVDTEIINADDSARQDPVLTLAEVDWERGGEVAISARFDVLEDVVATCCASSLLGWQAVVVDDASYEWGWRLELQLRLGVDRSQNQSTESPVTLSEAFGTAKIKDFCDTLPETNFVIVAGQGEGAERHLVSVGLQSLSGIMRRESFCDARDTSDDDEMATRGYSAISDAISTSIEMEYLDISGFSYGSDFTIGDIVTVDAGVCSAYDLQIATVEITWSGGGETTIDLTLGTEIRDLCRLISDVYSAMPDMRR